jgi:hypothetical protein
MRRAVKPSDGGYDWGITTVVDGRITCIAEAFEVVGEATKAPAEANARLIAAAPDMLEALKDIESKIVDYEAGRINWRPDGFLYRVRQALAKACEPPSRP